MWRGCVEGDFAQTADGVCVPAQIRLDFQDLDLTTEDVNFDAIDDDLKRFQQDDIVKDALEKVWLQSAA